MPSNRQGKKGVIVLSFAFCFHTFSLDVNIIYALQVPSNRAKCAKFFRKCLDFLSEQDHLVFYSSYHYVII